MGQSLKMISWNVNGIRASVKKGFYEKVRELRPDILCIQETKSQNDVVETIAQELNEYQWFANSAVKKGYSGTAIFTRESPIAHKPDMDIDEHDQEGRLIALEYDAFYLINVYVPNSGQELKRLDYRKTWDEALCNYLTGLDKQKPIIFTGDLNVAHTEIDLARPKENYNKSAGYTQTEIDGLNKLLDAGLVDTFRHFHPDKIQYTFWNQRFKARERNVGWRIDYFLVSQRFISHVKDAFILDQVMGSDHCPVGILVEI
ncbi:MAG: exodeoxyribonuclease III [Bacteroidetes bacterium]|jgi:exodeoxyribonuclease-3|nr:exodeoxyribonuclease III [Bacteroidota bacterium]